MYVRQCAGLVPQDLSPHAVQATNPRVSFVPTLTSRLH